MKDQITVLRCGFANAYLVGSRQGSVLIDTAAAPYREKVLAACKGARVRLILLTHGHYDHCQNAAFLSQALGCPVAIARADGDLLSQGEKRPVQGQGPWGRLYAAMSNRAICSQFIEPIHPDLFLEEGLDLSPYGVSGRVIALPGHTAGSMGVLLAGGGLFAGDAAQSLGPLGASWCWEDRAAARESMARIRALAKGKVYCGHGW